MEKLAQSGGGTIHVSGKILFAFCHQLERSFELTRSLSVELAPAVLHERGLAAAFEWLATETRKNYNVEATVETDSSANPKAPDVCIFLFRAVRELLLNSVKHPSAAPCASRCTIVNIRERVSGFGGKFHINSDPRRVIRITLSLLRGSPAQVRLADGSR
jgi:signal transduction histidine kinase